MDFLFEFWSSLTLYRVLFGVGVFLLTLVFSILVISFVMVKIPANYFSPHYSQSFMEGSPLMVRWSAVILKNLLGVFLLIIGVVMLIGPGQGLLTILLGLIMMDIPGKRPLEARIIKRPAVLSAVNNLRARFNKPPLIME